MTTRTLISDDGRYRKYQVRDEAGNVIGTDDERVPSAEEISERMIQERASAALLVNAAYLAVTTPTTIQSVAQIRALTRECTALIRLALRLTDDTTGT